MCQIFPISSLVSVSVGATLAPAPQSVASVLMALILSGDRASQVLGIPSLSVWLSNSFL